MITDEELLWELRNLADEIGRSPTQEDVAQEGKHSITTYQNRFGSYWRSVVAAGLPPTKRTPLSESGLTNLHATALEKQNASHTLAALLAMFTPLPSELLAQMSESWIHRRTYSDPVIRVPADMVPSGSKWEFKLPSEFTTSDGETKKTHLPELLEWYLSNRELPVLSGTAIRRRLNKLAKESELQRRRLVERQLPDKSRHMVPKVTSDDLRLTLGTSMARNGAPTRRIRRHLGIDHTNWKADVENIYLWCHVHDDNFEHPDYDPPDVVLDPV
jgi:hypothetical protein